MHHSGSENMHLNFYFNSHVRKSFLIFLFYAAVGADWDKRTCKYFNLNGIRNIG